MSDLAAAASARCGLPPGCLPDAATLQAQHGGRDGSELIQALVTRGPLLGRTALVSSFGAESAVLLHMVAVLDAAFPVIFLDTGKHFPATLAYKERLVRQLGLANVRSASPAESRLAMLDPDGRLYASDPDDCCHLRKTEPLEDALGGYAAWITGRKRYQAGTRAALPVVEADAAPDGAPRLKINPLARWSADRVVRYLEWHDLPLHPLLQDGYRSIGCAPCTRAIRAGENPRAGRWFGMDKVECGIHERPANQPRREAA